MEARRKSVVVGKDEGLTVWSATDRVTLKVRSEHTAGEFALAECAIAPGGGPPPHVHLRADHMFYVLRGEVSFLVEEATFTAGPGNAIYVPRGTVHTFTNPSADELAHVLVWASSSNFESFMLEFGVPVKKSLGPPAVDGALARRLLAAADRHGIQLLPEHKPTIRLEAPPVPKALGVLGQRVTLKLIGRMTDERMCAALLDVTPGNGVPPHRHRREDEIFYVTSGALEFLVGGAWHVAPAGTTVFVPRGTFHGFRAMGNLPAQTLSIHTPAGFEHFFTEMGGLTIHGAEPSEPSAIAHMLEKHGMEVPV